MFLIKNNNNRQTVYYNRRFNFLFFLIHIKSYVCVNNYESIGKSLKNFGPLLKHCKDISMFSFLSICILQSQNKRTHNNRNILKNETRAHIYF